MEGLNLKRVTLAIITIALWGCHGGKTSVGDTAGEAADSGEKLGSALVEWVVAHPGKTHESFSAYGMVEFQPERTTSVSTQLEMIVNRVFVRAGQAVKAGDDLIEMRGSATSVLDAKRTATDVKFTQRELKRAETLFAEHLATNMELDTAKQAAMNAQAALEAVRARGVGVTQILRAPRAGIVADVGTEPGVMAAAGAILMRLAPSDALRVRAGLDPARLHLVKPGMSVNVFDLQNSSASVAGQIAQVAATLNPQTHLADVVILLDKRPLDKGVGLLPGVTVRCEILTQESVAISVPRTAILYEEERPYVYVVQSKQKNPKDKGALTAVKRGVEIGSSEGAQVAVLKGLVDGEQVVTSGNYELVDGMGVRAR